MHKCSQVLVKSCFVSFNFILFQFKRNNASSNDDRLGSESFESSNIESTIQQIHKMQQLISPDLLQQLLARQHQQNLILQQHHVSRIFFSV